MDAFLFCLLEFDFWLREIHEMIEEEHFQCLVIKSDYNFDGNSIAGLN